VWWCGQEKQTCSVCDTAQTQIFDLLKAACLQISQIIFQENQTYEKSTEILRNVKRLIQIK
jgi:hypothetical protein